jgi:hypothetical protein
LDHGPREGRQTGPGHNGRTPVKNEEEVMEAAISAPLQGAPHIDERSRKLVIIASLIGTTVEWYDFFLYGTITGLVTLEDVLEQIFGEIGDTFSDDDGADGAGSIGGDLLSGDQGFKTGVIPFALALFGDYQDFHLSARFITRRIRRRKK